MALDLTYDPNWKPDSKNGDVDLTYDPNWKPQGILADVKDSFVEGAKSAGRAIAGTADVYSGNEAGLVDKAKAQQVAPKPAPLQGFYDSVQKNTQALGDDPGLWDSVKAVGGAVIDNPKGAGLALIEQLPNSAPAIGGGLAGMKGGAAIGTAVMPGVGTAIGSVAGGLAGMFLGNAAIETGYKGIEAAQDGSVTPEEFGRVKKEGAIKGGVVTAVDAATLGLSKAVAGIPGRAVESATRNALAKAGVDITNEAAILAARQSPEISAAVRAAQESAHAAASGLGKRAAAGGAALGLETVGEGLGEYLGELAATGKANVADAVLEAVLSLGQSGAEVAWGAARNKEQSKGEAWDVAAQGEQKAAPTLITEPEPLQRRIDDLMGINAEGMNDKERAQYESDLTAAFLEPVGIAHDANGLEIPFTMADYLNGQVRAEDTVRSRPLRQNATQQSDARLQQVADEETTGYVAPEIPVVGTLSAVANMAVQSGEHQATVAQQAAQNEPQPTAPDFDVTHAATAALDAPENQSIRAAWTSAHRRDNGSRITHDFFEQWHDGGGVTPDVGSQYDAHGIAKGNPLGALLNILSNGINRSRRFDTAPLVQSAGNEAGAGAGLGTAGGAYKDGPFILLGARGKELSHGIHTVLVADGVANVIPQLQAKFPAIRFVKYSEAQSTLSSDSSAAHAAHVAQQQAAIQNSQAEASSTQPGKADTPTTGNREAAPQAGILAGIAAQAPSVAQPAPNTQPQGQGGMPATAQQSVPAAASPAGVEFDVSKRTNQQLEYLSQNGQPGWKEAATAEIQRRGVQISQAQQSNTDAIAPAAMVNPDTPAANSASVPALKASDSAKAPEIPNGDGVTDKPGKKENRGLSVGVMPNSAESVTVKDGVVHIGKYPAQNFDTGEDVTVPAGATDQQIVTALKDAGAIAPKHKVFGAEKEAQPAPEDTIGWTRMTTIEREGILKRAGYEGANNRLNLAGVRLAKTPWESMSDAVRAKLEAADTTNIAVANQNPVKNQSEQPLDMVEPVSQPKTDAAPEAKQDKASGSQFANSEPDADARFAKNTIFTADKVAAAKARMKAKLGTMNSGIDPELLIDGMTVAGAYIESGVRKFGDYAKAMIADLGDGVKPYLLSFYEAARAYPGLNKMGMDTQEEAAKQHQAILTPEVKEAAKEVVGESPKVEKKKPANLGEAVRLKADWGVRSIDGYTRSKTGKNQETDYGLKGGVKDEFLADAKRYLKAVSKLLENQGFETHVDNRGKGIAAVNSNEAGPAVSGDVYLAMRRGDFGVYAQVGVSSVRGIGPDHPQGVSLMVRVTPNAKNDRSASKGMNNWMAPDLAAGDLAAWFDKQYQAFAGRGAEVQQPVPEKTSYDLSNADDKFKVATEIADFLIGGGEFKTIIEARKKISEMIGRPIEAATELAKQADETIETAVVLAGRDIVKAGRKQGRSAEVIYDRLVDLYRRQPNLAVRSSTSVRDQAYSTPVPLAYLASELAGITYETSVYEPTAGNGMLLVGASADNVVANELNPKRAAMIRALMPEANVRENNGAEWRPDAKVDAVIANPPFGAVKDGNGETVYFSITPEYDTRELDHAIVFKALESLKDNGRAVLIVGGVQSEAEEARREDYRGKNKRQFYFNLYNNFNVIDHFTADGDLYSKQGASYPVDVIVINGRGKSNRDLPAADLPKIIKSYEELKEKLNVANRMEPAGSDTARTGRSNDQGRGGDAQGLAGSPVGSSQQNGDGGRQRSDSAGVSNAGRSDNEQSAGGRPVSSGGQLESSGTSDGGNGNRVSDKGRAGRSDAGRNAQGNRSNDLGGTSVGDGQRVESGLTDRRGQEQETGHQVSYSPHSNAPAVGTLVPRAMRDAIASSLSKISDQVGDIDNYVAESLDMDPETVRSNFSAEQIDALALSIRNAEAGKGFIIGDQTGIGKGRVVAAMIRYALVNGKTPIFVTEKPNLYSDMIRDLDDIGMTDELGLDTKSPRILITNGGESIPYTLLRNVNGEVVENNLTLRAPKAGKALDDLMQSMVNGDDLGDYKVIFTTYSQLQTVKGKQTTRQRFVNHFGASNYMIFDESHNAGGAGETQARTKEQRQAEKDGQSLVTGRAAFVRGLVQKAFGTFFSSATYAKRPDVMDLYSSTNMKLAVDRISQLGDAIKSGGVPMQQVVANMLTQDGQYIRRERTFAGVDYNTKETVVDQQTAENMASAMRSILAFSRAKEGVIKQMQKEYDKQGAMLAAVGGESTSVQGANFGSIMHNLIDQMLLSLKAKSSVDHAIERLKAGEKVVMTVSNTMGSFLKDYADEFGVMAGDPVALSFSDLYVRYLEKQRIVSIKAGNGEKRQHRLTDAELGPTLVDLFNKVRKQIDESGFGSAPISPIDYMHAELRKAGYKTDEITGRTITLNYHGETPVLASRSANIKQRVGAVSSFNNGDTDVLILNQAGSTGLSLHASSKFKDKRKRHMIIVQAEKNIDTHMQMLGRIHRTGQVTEGPFDEIESPGRVSIAAKARGIRAKVRALEAEEKRISNLAKSKSGKVRLETLRRDIARQKARLESMRNSQGFDGDAGDDTSVRTYNGKPAAYGLPIFSQLMADIPAELRPASVLMKKMASLNANTTASRTSSVTAEGVVDFMNDYGGQVVHEYLRDNPDILEAVGGNKVISLADDPAEAGEDDIRKFTGYIPILPIKQQEEVYRELIDRYNELIERENSLGTNKLEAKAVDLDAETISSQPVTENRGDPSVFAAPANMEKVDVKRTVKPYSSEEVSAMVAEALGGKRSYEIAAQQTSDLTNKATAYGREKVAKMTADGVDPVKIESQKAQLNLVWSHAKTVLSSYRIGDSISIKDQAGQFLYGVITSVEHSGRTANPAAGSAWKMHIALANGDAKSITISFSQIGSKYELRTETNVDWYNIETQSVDRIPVLDIFDKGSKVRREKRWIVTGNILAGFARFPGQIITYTKNDGTTAQGVLMSRQFDFEKEQKNAPVRIKDGKAAINLFTNSGPGTIIGTPDRNLMVAIRRGEYEITVPSSKKDGGTYYLDQGLTNIVGDFYKRGSIMSASVYTTGDLERMVNYLVKDREENIVALSNVEKAKELLQGNDGSVGNIAAPGSMSPADKAIYGMAAEGKSAADILKFIASASRNPMNRQLAKLLLKTGIAPTITVGDGKGWKMNAGEGNKYAAGYNPKSDTISLFRPASAERNMLHELIHAATLKALSKKGMASAQMNALYTHVKKSGKLKGMYGMSDVDEFIAEAFSNPKFQEALKQVSAMPVGGNPSSAWDWFVRVVRGILGLKQGQDNALSQALDIGIGVMRENMRLNEGSADVRYNAAPGKINQTDTEAFKRWFGKSKVVDANGEPLIVYHGTGATGISAFNVSDKGTYGGGIYFTPDIRGANDYAIYRGAPSSTVYPVYVAIKNPASGSEAAQVASWKGEENAREELIRRGYDGVVDIRSGEIVAFYPTQIKSATGNNGDFDAGNPDIRYNVADDGWSVSEPSKMDDLIYAMQDKQIDMKRVVQSIMRTGKKVKDEVNAYLQEELFHGRAAKGVKDFLDFELRPLLKQMQEAKVDMGDFEEYLWNRHAEERNKQIAKINPDMPDGGSGIETAKARAYLAGLSAGQRKTFEALAAKVEAMNRESQRVLIESGLEKQSTIDAWNNAYQHYVPLQREDVDSGHVGTGKGFSVRGSSTKRAMGSGRQVVDIIANLTMQRERNIVRAEKNRVSNALLGLAVQNPNPDFWKVDQAPKERVVNNVAIYNVLDANGKKVADFTKMDEADRMARNIGGEVEQTWGDRVQERIEPGFLSRDNVLLTRVNGQDHYIIFNERDERAMRMAMAMKNLDVDGLGRVLSVVGKATRYLSSINTQYNPVFGVINLIRDAQGALINLSSTPLAGEQKRVLGYTKDALVGIYKDIRSHRAGKVPSSKWAALFEEFQKEGGQTGYRDQYANAEARAEAIKAELEQFKDGKAKQFTRGLFGWLSDYNETMENAVRLASYKAAKEKGMSNQQAASLAKNITVNFNRKGQMATQVGALYAFFNASVQGTARIAETLFEQHGGDIKNVRLSKKGKQIVLGGIMLGSMQALLLAAAGYGDDEPPEFVRERNLILPIGDGKYLTLAMPLGLHVIPGIGRIATEFVLSGGKDPLKRIAAFGSMFADAFNPVGSAGWSLQTITPSVVDPFAALAENKDFTGKEIYREDFNKLNPTPGHTRAKDKASIWSRAISEGLNFITGGSDYRPGLVSPSPDSIDYLIGQATGGVGREVSKLSQTIGAASTGEDLPLYKVPLVGRFVGDTQGKSGQSQRFYDNLRQINMHEAEYKGLMKDGKRDEAREYLAENPAVKLIMAGNHAELAVRKLRTMKRDLVENEADPAKVRAIDDRITATMRAFNERAANAI